MAAKFSHLLPQDVARLRGLQRRIEQQKKRNKPHDRLAQRLESQVEEAETRLANYTESRDRLISHVHLDEALPVCQAADEIREAIVAYPVTIVCGDTGSGKTTQLPKLCLQAGRGTGGRIGVTQPRRLAAVSVAKRVAEEMEEPLGQGIGYQVRFDDSIDDETVVKFMTDGILLAEIHHDRQFWQYDTIIVDEAHERSLNIDFILGYLKTLLDKRPEVRIVISSASLDAQRFSQFFKGAPVIQVEGRSYPIDDMYMPPLHEDEDLPQHVARAVTWITDVDDEGDILVFLPGEREIRDSADLLSGRQFKDTVVLPLYARLSMGDQQRIFSPGKKRRIVLSTNVAETSLTIPRIRYVVDSGVVRMSRYATKAQVQRLQIEDHSQASAKQRRGRCGRMADGICVRLFSEEALAQRPEFTDPEIRRTSLAGVILQMKALGLDDISTFPFIDPPRDRAVTQGYQTLIEIGAMDKERSLTQVGKQLSHIPVDPRLGRMLMMAAVEGCLQEVVPIVAGLSIQDPLERPQEKRKAADKVHEQWKHDDSDFMSLLNLYQWWQEQKKSGLSSNRLRKLCKESFVSFRRMGEWDNIVRELKEQGKALKWRMTDNPSSFDAIHRAILSGVVSHIGMLEEKKAYRGASSRQFFLFPGSGQFAKTPKWVMCGALVETTKLFARSVASMQPNWVEKVAPQVCRHAYSQAHWNEKQGAVYAYESVSAYGLPIVDKRRVFYGKRDPEASHEIFIRDGIMAAALKTKGDWLAHNHERVEAVRSMEVKMRRLDYLIYDAGIEAFYRDRVPAHINTTREFEVWRLDIEKENPRHLFLTDEDVIMPGAVLPSEQDYPNDMTCLGASFALSYKIEPEAKDNGVTATCPVDRLGTFPAERLLWSVPGYRVEIVEALLRSLPKALRTRINPIAERSQAFVAEVTDAKGDLRAVLAWYLKEQCDVHCGVDDFDLARVPKHLIMKLRVVDEAGKTLAVGSQVDAIREALHDYSKRRFERLARTEVQASGITSWTVGTLEREVGLGLGHEGLKGFSALEDHDDSVSVKLFKDEHRAAHVHGYGVVRLFTLTAKDHDTFLLDSLPLSTAEGMSLKLLTHSGVLRDLCDLAVYEAMQLEHTAVYDELAFEDACVLARQESFDHLETICNAAKRWLPIWSEFHERIKELPEKVLHAQDFVVHMRHLFSPRFFLRLGGGRWQHYERYLRGLQSRWQRYRESSPKDQNKYNGFLSAVRRFELEFEPRHHDPFMPSALNDYGWLLEEMRIATFAPEVGTKQKVSIKRLDALWEQVEAQIAEE